MKMEIKINLSKKKISNISVGDDVYCYDEFNEVFCVNKVSNTFTPTIKKEYQEKIIIGVNMFHLFKLINTIDTDETLSIYIENDDYNDGIVEHLVLKFENKAKEQCKIQKLKLIEPDHEELNIPDVKFSSIINLPSNDFQKIIRDLNGISDKLEIKSIKNQLIFKCQGSFASAEIIRSESDGMGFIQKHNKVIQGEFSLKNLSYFIKCTNLCNQIEMYMENDLPLIIQYNVASLGVIKLGLAPLPASSV